uniref:Uncharacterized protein n=1 Tax=Sphaerodactylus townsendi TaxID=933632 RepID=A0ACB8E614_9SAUR
MGAGPGIEAGQGEAPLQAHHPATSMPLPVPCLDDLQATEVDPVALPSSLKSLASNLNDKSVLSPQRHKAPTCA